MLEFVKAHAYGNDFVYVDESQTAGLDLAALARRLCDRHAGIGADGLIVYSRDQPHDRVREPARPRARMRLINADGSRAEISGNGVRGLAALVARTAQTDCRQVIVDTDAGEKTLALVETAGGRVTFRAAMGQPADLRIHDLDAAGRAVRAVSMRMGNPQCVVLGEALPHQALFEELGAAIERHPAFPERTNVEFAVVEAPERLRILIWERGVGPTRASGTGACAAAVAAAWYAGASRISDVMAPGGTQRVEWLEEVYLTGWAEVLFEGRWVGP